MPTKPFLNPYLKTPDRRLATYISEDAYRFFRAIRLDTGTFTTLTNTMVDKLHKALLDLGIDNPTQSEDFEHFVANCILTLPSNERTTSPDPINSKWITINGVTTLDGSTSGGVDQQTSPPDDNRRTKSKGKRSAKVKTKQSGTASSVPGEE